MLSPSKNEIRKPTKSISGITPVAVMLTPKKCKHGTCLYCPSLNVPQSYTPKSPAVMRAISLNYNPYEQVKARIKSFEVMHHPTDKIELIVMGGTFLDYPEKFQTEFIKKCFDAMNCYVSKNLKQAQRLNEKAKHRCVALCIETRPDVCSDKNIKRMLELGATRVELGVQIIDDEIYKKINRCHKVKDVVDATERLKNAGFKVGYHIMPGLPFSNSKKDLQLFKKLFSDEKFKPDQLKIYPCQVIKGSELENWYYKKKYNPYTKEQTEKILLEMLKIVPRYCRVMRIMREIPPDYLVAGTTRIDLRKDIEFELRKNKIKLKEIRFREIGFAKTNNIDLKLKITKYKASNGTEYFLEIVNSDDILFGLLRLRIFDERMNSSRYNLNLPQFATSFSSLRRLHEIAHPPPAQKLGSLQSRSQINKNLLIKKSEISNINNKLTKTAIIREIHVYGQALKLGENRNKATQHHGLGKRLLREAEIIAKKNKCNKISIISGVGVRDYYKKLGYNLEESYMVKELHKI